MSKRPWIKGISFVLALVILAAAALRPPGVMPGNDNGVFTYVICTGDGVRTISVPAEDGQDIPEQADPNCAFFASQIAALPSLGTDAVRISIGASIRRSQFISDLHARQPARLTNAARAPPLETELS